MTRDEMERAVSLLRAGELVAIPTETVYGLGADASNPAALKKIFSAKGRPADHPLIVHIADASQLGQWAIDIPEAAKKLADAFWPGPLTLILKRQPGVSDLVTGGQETVGVRVPDHSLALQLLKAFSGGIAAPSANRFGHISPTTAQHVRDELGDAVALVLDGGPCAVGIESTIVDLSRGAPVVLRPGMISEGEISRVLDEDATLDQANSKSTPRVSGSLESHYAPTTPMYLVSAQSLDAEAARLHASGQRVAVLSGTPLEGLPALQWRQAAVDARQYAHDLYAHLRYLDGLGFDNILVELPPRDAAWTAIHDRLARAAHKA